MFLNFNQKVKQLFFDFFFKCLHNKYCDLVILYTYKLITFEIIETIIQTVMENIRIQFVLDRDNSVVLNMYQELTFGQIIQELRRDHRFNQVNFKNIRLEVQNYEILDREKLREVAALFPQSEVLIVLIKEKVIVSSLKSKRGLKMPYLMKGRIFGEILSVKYNYIQQKVYNILSNDLDELGLHEYYQYLKIFYENEQVDTNAALYDYPCDNKKPIEFEVRFCRVKLKLLVYERMFQKLYPSDQILKNCIKEYLPVYFCYLVKENRGQILLFDQEKDSERILLNQKDYGKSLDSFLTKDKNEHIIIFVLKFKEITIKTYLEEKLIKIFKVTSTQKMKELFSEKEIKGNIFKIYKEQKVIDMEKVVDFYAIKDNLEIELEAKERIIDIKNIVPLPTFTQSGPIPDVQIKNVIKQKNNMIMFTKNIIVKPEDNKLPAVEEKIEQLPHYQTNVNQVLEKFPENDALQLIMQSYQRCISKIDEDQSKNVEQKLKKETNNHQFNKHPLIILGESLKQKQKKVYYLEKSNPLSYYSFMHITSMYGGNYQGYKCKLSENNFKTKYSYASIISSEDKLKNFTSIFVSEMSKLLNNTVESIIINSIDEDFTVNFYTVIDVDIKLKGKLESLGEYTMLEYDLFETLALDVTYLNNDCTNFIKAQQQRRGGFPYYQPAGWIRYGIKIGNDDWQGIDEWAVMYHALRDKKLTTKILKENFKLGPSQIHELYQPIISKWTKKVLKKKNITQTEYLNPKQYTVVDTSNNIKTHVARKNTIGKGIYGTPLISVCQQSCEEFTLPGDESRKFLVAFQCRVKPQQIYISSKQKVYWIIRESKHIRAYGLLINERQKSLQPAHKKLNDKFKQNYLGTFQQKQETSCSIF